MSDVVINKKHYDDILRERDEYKRERDALAEALRSIQQMANSDLREFDCDHLFTWQIEADARAALAMLDE